jgi:beta-lactam-binding protein with PASTA domain/tRNA A-37 threonylcarbamoyl transferase component Bud32
MERAVDERAGQTGDAATPAIGSVLAGRYHLEARVAAGGMATIYRAKDRILDRAVAVKVLHPHLAQDRTLLERFRVEARSAAALVHPNVVNVFDQGVAGLPYIVMEFVDGPSLRTVLNVRGRLPAAEALAVLRPVCSALTMAHRAGTVHRDVKPENVLVASEDGTVKVTDFGVARILSATPITESGVVLGSVHYLAPEVVAGADATPASDQFAVGLMLFELLTGQRPLPGDGAAAVAVRRAREPVPPPSRFAQGVSPRIDAVVARATAMSPGDRYPHLQAFIADLRAAVPGGPKPVVVPSHGGYTPTVVVPPVQPGEVEPHQRRHRRSRRHRGPTQTLHLPALSALRLRARALPAELRLDDPVRRAVLGVAALLVLLAGGLGLRELLFPVRVLPALQAVSYDEAVQRLEAMGLDPVSRQVEPSREVPEGAVISTSPAAGERLRRGSDVTLVTSSGPPLVVVPDLAGLTEEQALATLRGLDLVPQVARAFSTEGVPAGIVAGQQPGAGGEVRVGAEVAVTISEGVEQVRVPNVTGEPQASAEEELAAAGLLTTVRQEFSDAVPTVGQVIGQLPRGGRQAARGTTVELIVSAGPANITVPDLWQQPVEQARTELEALGLTVTVNELPMPLIGTIPWGSPGLVEAMTPPAGSLLPRGSEVVLSTWADPAVVPPTPAPPNATAPPTPPGQQNRPQRP